MSLRSLVDCLAVVFLRAELWVNSWAGKCETLAVAMLTPAPGRAGSTNPPELCQGGTGGWTREVSPSPGDICLF